MLLGLVTNNATDSLLIENISQYKYQFLFPIQFLEGMLGYDSFESRRRVYFEKHFFMLLVNNIFVKPNYYFLKYRI